MSAIGAVSPSIEYTLSNAISFGAAGSVAANFRRRSAKSLCAHTWLRARLCRIPSIIEAWLPASESTTQLGRRDARVDSDAQFAEAADDATTGEADHA
jgi:hypothetical protein